MHNAKAIHPASKHHTVSNYLVAKGKRSTAMQLCFARQSVDAQRCT